MSRLDSFFQHLRDAIRHMNECRALADGEHALVRTIDQTRALMGAAIWDAWDAAERNCPFGIQGDIGRPEDLLKPSQSALRLLMSSAEAVAQTLDRDSARAQIDEQSRLLAGHAGPGGLSHRLIAGLLAKAAADVGLSEAAARVWALQTLNEQESP